MVQRICEDVGGVGMYSLNKGQPFMAHLGLQCNPI